MPPRSLLSRRILYLVFALVPVALYAVAEWGLVAGSQGVTSTDIPKSPWFPVAYLSTFPILLTTPILLLEYFVDVAGSGGVISGRRRTIAFLTVEATFYAVYYATFARGLQDLYSFDGYAAPIWPGLPAFGTILMGYFLRDRKDRLF